MPHQYSYEIYRDDNPNTMTTTGLSLLKDGIPIESYCLDTLEEAITDGEAWIDNSQEEDKEEEESQREYLEMSKAMSAFVATAHKVIDEM